MKASNPIGALQLLVADAVELAEQIEHTERSLASTQLLVAARVFAGAVDVFVAWMEREPK